MLKTIKYGGTILRRVRNLTINERTFLSEAYQCNEVWNHRFDDPILRKINPNDMFFELEQRFNLDGKASAVDVDIFANSVQDEHQVNELISVLLKHRATPETTNTLESTHHAVVRFLMQHNCTDLLHEILDNRIHYGIFPDNHIMNVLMDSFIKKGDFASAAKVAVLSMLQEDTSNPLTNALSAYSCHKYLENADTWKLPEPEPVNTKEVIKIRIRYIRNPFFDDHFDLREPRDLVGKTLAFHGKHMGKCLGRSCALRGLVLYKKYDKAMKLMNEWNVANEEFIIHKDVYDLIAKDTSYLTEDEKSEDLKNLQLEIKKFSDERLNDESLEKALENHVKLVVKEQTEKDIDEQTQKYLEWERIRATELERYLNEQNRLARLHHLEKLKKEMQDKELLLTFFDKEEEIELEIEKKLQLEQEEIARLGTRYTKAMRRLEYLGEEGFMDAFMKVKKDKK